MKKLVVFGFDGTLADTAPGILYCFNTTAVAMGYEPVEHSALYGVIGAPLEYGFKTLFNMSDDEIEYAVKNYSKLYSQKGKEYRRQRQMRIRDSLTKSHLLLQACEQTGVSVEESILVGDSTIEAKGAEEIGMDFLAVLYGWGFKTKEETEEYKCVGTVSSPAEISQKVMAL